VGEKEKGRYGKYQDLQNAAKKANMRMNKIRGENKIISTTPIIVRMSFPKMISRESPFLI
jgi:hypothetical protein